MVFQAGKPAMVWGQDDPGQKVEVSLGGKTARTKTDSHGHWKVQLSVPPAGGPYEMTITGSSSRHIQDILVGEVWLGSGQSNMQFRLDQDRDAKVELSRCSDPQLRLFLQKLVMSPEPLAEPQGEWKVCSPEAAKSFSAVSYYFGKDLRKDLKVPVGMIASSWGGSYVESWMPEKVLRRSPFHKVWERWNTLTTAEKKAWQKGRFPVDLAVRNLRLIPQDPAQAPLTLQASGTASMAISQLGPGQWASSVKEDSLLKLKIESGAPHMTGTFLNDAWGFMTTGLARNGTPKDLSSYRSVEFEARGSGLYILFLSQPSIADWDNYRTPRSFRVDRSWKHHRIEFSSLKQSGWGKQVPFTPEAVSYLSFGVDPQPLIDIPSALYNAMIHPFTAFPIRGFLWYQGEANAIYPDEYQGLLAAMVDGWRKAWKDPSMPFLIAQLPNYIPGEGQGIGHWGDIREAQRRVGEKAHNGIAVLLDLGEHHDIHPKDKADVGFRLAQIALGNAYGKKNVRLCPLFEKAEWEDGKVRVRFKQTGNGLESRGSDLKGFEVAGADGVFHPAQGKVEKDSVMVWSDQVTHPQAVRYAWADDPVFNLYGKNGMPASPFKASRDGQKE
ncbi:MAG TPA: sialate O-acetylesterase [bacterium]|nr:sialate O-acetylesterase [bacterium]